MAREYKEQKNAETTVKILELETILPDFCHGYIVSISGYNKPLTQLAYLQRIQFFLQWLLEYNSFFCKHYTKINEFKVSDLELLKKADFEEFLAHISKFGAVSKEEIKYFVLHQANKRIIEAAARRLKQPIEKFPMNIDRCANTTSATIPILLDEINQKGMLNRGDKIVLSGFGGGLTWGSVYLTW